MFGTLSSSFSSALGTATARASEAAKNAASSSSGTSSAAAPSSGLTRAAGTTTAHQSTVATGTFSGALKSFADDAARLAEKTSKHATKLAEQAALQAQNTASILQEEYRATFEEQLTKIFDIIPKRLLIMEYPNPVTEEAKLQRIAGRLNRQYGRGKYLVLNMSEHTYPKGDFEGEVMDVRFRGLPAPPLSDGGQLFFKLVISVKQWLDGGKDFAVVVHCYSGYTRSAMFCACYLFWSGYCQSTLRGLEYTLKRLKLNANEDAILPTQKRYMDYFEHILTEGPKVAKTGKYLTRVLITGIPNFSPNVGAPARPVVQDDGRAAASTTSQVTAGGGAVDQTQTGKGAGAADEGPTAGSSAAASSSPKPPPPPPAAGGDAPAVEKNRSSSSSLFGGFSFDNLRSSSKDSKDLLSNFQKDFSVGLTSFQKSFATSSATAMGDMKKLTKDLNSNMGSLFAPATRAAGGGDAEEGAAGSPADDAETGSSSSRTEPKPIFVPYLEIWHKEKLVYTSWNSLSVDTSPSQEYFTRDSCVPFPLKDADATPENKFLCGALDGDVLLRVRHFDKDSKAKSSAFRLGFNTGYVENNFLHFPNTELDVATREFPKDGFVDLFFEDDTRAGSQKSNEKVEEEKEIFVRGRQMFEKMKEEEMQRLRQQLLDQKLSESRGPGGERDHGKDHLSDAGSLEDRGEEEFDRLQRQLLEAEQASPVGTEQARPGKLGEGGGATTVDNLLDTADVYELNWSNSAKKEHLEEKAKAPPTQAAMTIPVPLLSQPLAPSDAAKVSTASAAGPRAGAAVDATVPIIDMTTPKSNKSGTPTATEDANTTAPASTTESTAAPPPPPAEAAAAPQTSSVEDEVVDEKDASTTKVEEDTTTSAASPEPGVAVGSPGDDDLLDSLLQDAGDDGDGAEKDKDTGADELDDLLTLM